MTIETVTPCSELVYNPGILILITIIKKQSDRAWILVLGALLEIEEVSQH
jgi:hypothetical protein